MPTATHAVIPTSIKWERNRDRSKHKSIHINEKKSRTQSKNHKRRGILDCRFGLLCEGVPRLAAPTLVFATFERVARVAMRDALPWCVAVFPVSLPSPEACEGASWMDFRLRLAPPPLRPNSQEFTWDAKRALQTLSSVDSSSGERFTNINVFPSPLKQGDNRCVSLLLRKGICFWLEVMAVNTSDKQLRLLLIAHASFKRAPSAPDFETRSLPARSTKIRQPSNCWPAAS